MDDGTVLTVQCKKCNNNWFPFGEQKMNVPYSANVVCPECGNQQSSTWLDNETSKKLAQQKLGIRNDDEQNRKIRDLEQNLELLKKEVELEKKKHEILEIQLEKLTMWAEDREEDFQKIEACAQDLNDEQKFQEDNK